MFCGSAGWQQGEGVQLSLQFALCNLINYFMDSEGNVYRVNAGKYVTRLCARYLMQSFTTIGTV